MQNRKKVAQWLGMATACVLAVSTAPAVTTNFYVATNGLDTRTGIDSWANAVATISNAVWKASYGSDNVVFISNGTYYLTTSMTFGAMSVLGFSGNRDDVIVDCQHLTWAFWMTSSRSLLAHVTVKNGRSTDLSPGGVHVQYGLMSNCVVTDCEAASLNQYYNGGGVHITHGKVTCCTVKNNNRRSANNGGGGVVISPWGSPSSGKLLDSYIIGNSSSNNAGGVALISNYGAIVSNCTIINNYAATNGGGMYDRDTNTVIGTIISSNRTDGVAGGLYASSYSGTGSTVSNCTINYNSAKGDGGGVYSPGCIIRNSIINANRTDSMGGGLYLSSASKVYLCLIAGNTSTRSAGAGSTGAGGIYLTAGGVLENCTIVGNQVSGTSEGGGIYCGGAGRIRNTIIYANTTATATSSNWYNNGSAMFYTNCCTMPTAGLQGNGNISENPRCVNIAGRNYRLRGDSPCNNAGTNQDWMTNSVDLDSQMRIRYGTVDIGAYETIYDATLYRAW